MFDELDLKALWKELDDYSAELDKETTTLQEVWVKIAQLKEQNESEMKEVLSKEEFDFLPPETVIGINVGGQLFEVPVAVLTVDQYSILAAVCRVNTPVKPDKDGLFFFDRDWWIFRHILNFLKLNKLPNEIETLKELYREASFYRLEKLQRAIEDVPVDQVTNYSPQITVVAQGLADEHPVSPIRRDFLEKNTMTEADRVYGSRSLFRYK